MMGASMSVAGQMISLKSESFLPNILYSNWTISVSNVSRTLNTSVKPEEGFCINKSSVFVLPNNQHGRFLVLQYSGDEWGQFDIKIAELIVHTES